MATGTTQDATGISGEEREAVTNLKTALMTVADRLTVKGGIIKAAGELAEKAAKSEVVKKAMDKGLAKAGHKGGGMMTMGLQTVMQSALEEVQGTADKLADSKLLPLTKAQDTLAAFRAVCGIIVDTKKTAEAKAELLKIVKDKKGEVKVNSHASKVADKMPEVTLIFSALDIQPFVDTIKDAHPKDVSVRIKIFVSKTLDLI